MESLLLVTVSGGDVWIGLNALDNEYYYVWSDGSGVTITNWWINEPAGRVSSKHPRENITLNDFVSYFRPDKRFHGIKFEIKAYL